MNKFLSNKVAIALFALPALIIYSMMLAYPIIQTMVKSFYEWDGFTEGEFIFLDNYVELFRDDIQLVLYKNGSTFLGTSDTGISFYNNFVKVKIIAKGSSIQVAEV